MKIFVRNQSKKQEVHVEDAFLEFLYYKTHCFEKENSEELDRRRYIRFLVFKLIVYIAMNCLTEREKYVFLKLWVVNRGERTDWKGTDTYQNKFNIHKTSIKNIIKVLKYTGYWELIEEVLRL